MSLSFPGGSRSWISSPLPSLLLQTPLLPSVVHSAGPWLGCSGDKDVLSCFLGEPHPSCTLPYSRAWVVLGKATWNHLSPTLHTEETKAPRGEVAFPSQFTCQDKTHDDSQPRVQPTRPWGGPLSPGSSLHGLCFSPLRNPSSPVKVWGFSSTQTLPGSTGFLGIPPNPQGVRDRRPGNSWLRLGAWFPHSRKPLSIFSQSTM